MSAHLREAWRKLGGDWTDENLYTVIDPKTRLAHLWRPEDQAMTNPGTYASCETECGRHFTRGRHNVGRISPIYEGPAEYFDGFGRWINEDWFPAQLRDFARGVCRGCRKVAGV